ncbi:hypothetical protein HOLleu_38589 [Holothuria leucospilota]|uniref:Ig-like domain-containing protein n=1 Tax=Holothuria leucospilota TaxID=206669 RepID=A0A9Q0YH99_HOLLE|nr:hypothetical protein HOLleu_38589 [Holothuria leucospilota]
MKLCTILTFFWIVMKVSLTEVTLHWQNDEWPILFEGTTYSVICADGRPTQEVSLLKDGELIGELNQTVQQISDCMMNLDICYVGALGDIGFIFQITWNNLTIESNGVYTCQVNESYSIDLSVEVSERKVTCETPVRYRKEYSMGEELMLTCYNPFEDSGLTAGWYLENRTKLETEAGFNPSSSTTIISLEEKYNSTSYDCFLVKNNTISENPIHSCSVGPIFVYNSSFIRIESFNGSYIGSTKSVTINCRIIPQGEEVTYDWFVDTSVATIEMSTSGVESNLTLSNFSLGSQYKLEIIITCEGMLSDMNFTAEYNLTVFNESLKRNNSFFIVIIVFSAVLTTMVIIIVIVVCCYIIVKRCRKTTLGISEEGVSKHNEVISAHGVVLNKYDKGPDYEQKHTYEEEDKRNSILSRLPDGRFHLERRPSAISNGSSFSNASEPSVQETVGDIYDDPPMRTSIPLGVITLSTPDGIIRPSFQPPPPPAQYTTSRDSPTTPLGTDFTNELKNRLSSSGELPAAQDTMIYDDPPSDHLYYSDDQSPVYASAKKEKSFYNEPEDQYTECESGVNEGNEPEETYADIMEIS